MAATGEGKSDLKFFDIAANMADEKFKGRYYGKVHHNPDFDKVIQRAEKIGVKRFLFTAGYIEDAEESHFLAQKGDNFYTTIGVHPCRASNVFKGRGTVEVYQERIEDTISKFSKSKLVAIGEGGLDYDRLNFANEIVQNKVFPMHFDLAEKYDLPMYLHSRATGGDFNYIVKAHRDRFRTGVVHSFTGSADELKEILDMGLYVGVNGCSMKTKQNGEIVKRIPVERMMLETDGPYGEIRKNYFSFKYLKTLFSQVKGKRYEPDKMVKFRNEPGSMKQVSEAVSAIKGINEKELTDIIWENTNKMLNLPN